MPPGEPAHKIEPLSTPRAHRRRYAKAFSDGWINALLDLEKRGLTKFHLIGVIVTWAPLWASGPLREPHIEFDPAGDDGPEVRFTWNRNGHYLDFAVLADGRVEWFYNAPDDHHEGTKDAPDTELPARFYDLLQFARP